MEISCQLILAVDLSLLSEDDIKESQTLIDELDIQLNAYH